MSTEFLPILPAFVFDRQGLVETEQQTEIQPDPPQLNLHLSSMREEMPSTSLNPPSISANQGKPPGHSSASVEPDKLEGYNPDLVHDDRSVNHSVHHCKHMFPHQLELYNDGWCADEVRMSKK